MAKRILVTGGTSTLGRAADRLAAQGHEVRAVSRHAPADGEPGSFTWMAVDLLGREVPQRSAGGMDVIVHCASGRRGDVEAARNLIAGARRRPDHPRAVPREHADTTGDTKAQPAPRTR